MLLLSGPNICGNEWKYVKDCLDTGWVSSVGSYVDQFEKMTAEFAGTKYAVATSSGTTALHICLVMLGINENDYIIAPNITFIATCNAIKYTEKGEVNVLVSGIERNETEKLLCFKISDTGIGIPKKMLDIIHRVLSWYVPYRTLLYVTLRIFL